MVTAGPAAAGGSALALDPRTGEILALATYPSFDNNLFARGIKGKQYEALIENKRNPMLNRPLAAAFPAGSTIKPLVAAAGLQEGVITANTKIVDRGVISVGSFNFYGWNRSGLGGMDVFRAMAMSSDPFFYLVGGGHPDYGIEGLGIERLSDYMFRFGLGKRTGINLPGEAEGLVPTPAWKKQKFAGTDEQNWYQGNTYHVSIGQGDLLVTPLQLTQYVAAVANGGKIYRPLIAKTESPEVKGEVGVSADNLKIVREAMREVILSGTSQSMKRLPVSSAGKTGTAQFGDLTRTHAWFSAFAPYEDPQIVVTAMVESGGGGEPSAVPIVRESLRWWAANRFAK